MAYNFAKLADAELLESVPENANAFVEIEGAVKRVPGSGLGGSKTAVIVIDEGTASSVSLLSASDGARATSETTATCENMTFEEAKAAILAGVFAANILATQYGATVVFLVSGAIYFPAESPKAKASAASTPENIMLAADSLNLYWTPDGVISSVAPA